MSPAVYVQTNDATDNEVVMFRRAEDGALAPAGRWSTGGRGSGVPHLADINELRRTQGQEVAALEVDTEILFPANVKRSCARNNQSKRTHASQETFAEKVDVLR